MFACGEQSTVLVIYIEEKVTLLGVIPYFHVYSNITCLNVGFFSAATQIQLPRFDINELFEAIGEYEQITFFPAVPLITAVVNIRKLRS